MAQYTTLLRTICESYAGLSESRGNASVDGIIEAARPKIFDFTYPCWSEEGREELERLFLSHYYMREICCETVGLWKLFLKNKMRDIMPNYVELYKTTVAEFNPLWDTDSFEHVINEHNDTKTDTEHRQNDGYNKQSGETWTKHSDTPQGGIDGLVDDEYMSSAEKIEPGQRDDFENHSRVLSGNVKNNGDYDNKIYRTGKFGTQSYQSLIKEWRENIIDIESMIIEECSDLFFGLWA